MQILKQIGSPKYVKYNTFVTYMTVFISIRSTVTKLILAVLDVSFNSGHYTMIIKPQFLYISQKVMIRKECKL